MAVSVLMLVSMRLPLPVFNRMLMSMLMLMLIVMPMLVFTVIVLCHSAHLTGMSAYAEDGGREPVAALHNT